MSAPDGLASLARLAAALLVAGAFAALVVARPKLEPTDAITLQVHARERRGRLDPIWDETNLWKLYLRFGVHEPDPAEVRGERWIARQAPWLGWARVNAALGGNHAAPIAPWCDHHAASPEHPEVVPGECGHDGVPGPAARNEFVHGAGPSRTVDHAPLRTAVQRLLRSGVKPHLNVSATPVSFTGGATDFFAYHWNGAPVTDLDGWSGFVSGAFGALPDLGTAGWRASIVNEPNCLTLVGSRRVIRHVGYSGTPREYARTFVATARAIRSAAPGIAIHAGNYVTSLTFPGEDNLPAYLRALADELAASPDFGWQHVTSTSTSLYETPDTSLYEFVPVRLARLEAAQRAAGLAPKPVKIDELEIHASARRAYEARHAQPLDSTLFAASWHAAALRAFVAAGNVVSSADWLAHPFDSLHDFVPSPKARVYGLLGLLAGQLDEVPANDGTIALERGARARARVRVAVDGGWTWQASGTPRFAPAGASGATRRTVRSRGALATRGHDTVRVLVVHHQNEIAPDASALAAALRRDVVVSFDGLGSAPGKHAGRRSAAKPASAGTDAPLRRCAGRTSATHAPARGASPRGPHVLHANAVWLVELRRAPRCA